MELESSYDTAFIDEELRALQDFFEIFENELNEKTFNLAVRDSAETICKHHQWLVENDMDSIVDMLSNYFFRILKTILPEKFDVGVMMWTRYVDESHKLLNLYFNLVAQIEIDAFVKHLAMNPDSRITIFGERGQKYWLVIIRMEKVNIFAQKYLK